MFNSLIKFIRDQFQTNEPIPLHAPIFKGNEKAYVGETIDSTFVSSVGKFVDRFEREMALYTGSPRAVAVVNGTAALHVGLLLANVKPGEIVITQALTFVATCNAIAYCGATPVFLDVDRNTLGLSPDALGTWLNDEAYLDDDGNCRLKKNQKIIRACVPMHTFGHPVAIEELIKTCDEWNLALVEDAAESLGSLYKGKHTGTFGLLGALSFNGNKIITTGGGGMVLSSEALGARAKHLTTTAKTPHAYEYVHDEPGYNYRLPNINSALGCAQLEQLEKFIAIKRELSNHYANFCDSINLEFIKEPADCRSNYWLNGVICESRVHRDALLEATNSSGIMTRPIWRPMHKLPMFANSDTGTLENTEWLEDRVVNLPSSVSDVSMQ